MIDNIQYLIFYRNHNNTASLLEATNDKDIKIVIVG
jgi:hypothetical protein